MSTTKAQMAFQKSKVSRQVLWSPDNHYLASTTLQGKLQLLERQEKVGEQMFQNIRQMHYG